MNDIAQHADSEERRIAIVVHPDLAGGEVANVVGILVGGLACDAFGEPVRDADGHPHAAVRCNVVVLVARSGGQLGTLMGEASEQSVRSLVFTRYGQQLSDSYATYSAQVPTRPMTQLEPIGVSLYGPRDRIRSLTKRFSLYR